MNENIKLLKEKLHGLNVLYVEDENEMRLGTEIFLNKFFATIVTAKNGEEGLEKFKDGKFDVVFTDILMPKMDGLKMIKEMKKIDSNIFSIALTASEVCKDDIQEETNLYFRKPIVYENMFYIMEEISKKFDL